MDNRFKKKENVVYSHARELPLGLALMRRVELRAFRDGLRKLITELHQEKNPRPALFTIRPCAPYTARCALHCSAGLSPAWILHPALPRYCSSSLTPEEILHSRSSLFCELLPGRDSARCALLRSLALCRHQKLLIINYGTRR